MGPRPQHKKADELAGVAIGSVLALIAAVRRGKAVHPTGVVYEAELVVPGAADSPAAAQLLSRAGRHRALVRFSRSVGVPRPIPDLLGMSIRVLEAYGAGAHQDLLLVTSADLPIVHHVFLPATDVQQRPYTSSLPYRAGEDLFLIGALPDERSPRPAGWDEFARLDAAARTGQLVFQVAVASLGGRFRPVAELRVGARLATQLDALRFNPWNTGGGLQPAGWLNGARHRAYKLSQGAWRLTRSDGASLQQAADQECETLAGRR